MGKTGDTTLERGVAIKILPESFATDDEGSARFEHEAKRPGADLAGLCPASIRMPVVF